MTKHLERLAVAISILILDYILDKPTPFFDDQQLEISLAAAITALYFHDDAKAREYLESIRWPDGHVVCRHCQSDKDHYRLEGNGGAKGIKGRPGLWKCSACREQFSVTVGTVVERSKIPLSKWLFAAYLLCSSKRGMSSHQLHRTLGVTYKTAWFLTHRIRHAMDSNGGLLGEGSGIIDADETYICRKPSVKKGRGGFRHKNTVLALLQRDGEVRSTVVTNFAQVKRAFKKHASPDSNLMTDQHKKFRKIGKGLPRMNPLNIPNTSTSAATSQRTQSKAFSASSSAG
jgi:transposase-like protein